MIKSQLNYKLANQDAITLNECKSDIKYYFDNPSAFDTGDCAEKMMSSVDEFISSQMPGILGKASLLSENLSQTSHEEL